MATTALTIRASVPRAAVTLAFLFRFALRHGSLRSVFLHIVLSGLLELFSLYLDHQSFLAPLSAGRSSDRQPPFSYPARFFTPEVVLDDFSPRVPSSFLALL